MKNMNPYVWTADCFWVSRRIIEIKNKTGIYYPSFVKKKVQWQTTQYRLGIMAGTDRRISRKIHRLYMHLREQIRINSMTRIFLFVQIEDECKFETALETIIGKNAVARRHIFMPSEKQ